MLIEVFLEMAMTVKSLQDCHNPKHRLNILENLLRQSGLFSDAVQKRMHVERTHQHIAFTSEDEMLLQYVLGLDDKLKKWASEFNQGISGLKDGEIIRDEYFSAMKVLDEKGLLSEFLWRSKLNSFKEMHSA